ncbi:unnamed protein product [Urochloa humidicola]
MESPAPYLPDDILVEILSRLPAKSICRFKLVSRSWRALIADPAHRHRFAQTLFGIFFSRQCAPWDWGFTSTPPPHGWGDGRDNDDDSDSPAVANSPLSFLPSTCGRIELLDSCNGLLLLLCSNKIARSPDPQPPAFYVVCNPATAEWEALPQPSLEPGAWILQEWETINTESAALGYDPSVSSNYHVFQLVQEQYQCTDMVKAVEIYSSETDTWVMRESGWRRLTAIDGHAVYFNGFLHYTTEYGESVAAVVDAKGQAWREIQLPCHSGYGFLGHSQGRLVYVDSVVEDAGAAPWAVYALENHDGDEWTLKHRISKFVGSVELFIGPRYCIAMLHPDCDCILFYDWEEQNLMSYDMNKGDVHVICTLREVNFNPYPFLPYVANASCCLLHDDDFW